MLKKPAKKISKVKKLSKELKKPTISLRLVLVATLLLLSILGVLFVYIFKTSPGVLAVSSPVTYYVSTTGSDYNTGTFEKPFKTIKKALTVVKPGNEIRIMPGTYKEALSISGLKGTSDLPIRIVGDSDKTDQYPIIDGGDTFFTKRTDLPGVKISNSSWIVFERLNFKHHTESTFNIQNSNYIVIRRNFIKYNKQAVKVAEKSNHILVEFNDISQNLPSTYTWTSLKDSKYEGGAYVSFGGAGYIEIKDNYIHDMFNGILMDNSSRVGNYYDANVFIYKNKFENIVDDPYEPETYAFNNHFFNNILVDTHRLVSVAPEGTQKLGPIYVYGNYMVVTKDPTKESVSKGRINSGVKIDLASIYYNKGVFIFNNTVDVNTPNIKGYGIDVLANTIKYYTSINNIYVTPGNVYTSKYLTLKNSFISNNMSNKSFGYPETKSFANTDPLLTNKLTQDGRLQLNSPALSKAVKVTVPLGFSSLDVVVGGDALGAYTSTGSLYSFPKFKYEVPSGGELLGFPANLPWPSDKYGGTNPKVTPSWVN